MSAPSKRPVIKIQHSDGITAAVCKQFGIGGLGRDRDSACKEVFDAIITNSKIVIRKQALQEDLSSPEEKLLKDRAGEFLRNQGSISAMFEYEESL